VIGGIFIGAFCLFLIAVVLSFIRALKKPANESLDTKTEEIQHFQDKLVSDTQFWF
jgi:hypothetical protein